MARPSRDESKLIESLEGASAALIDVQSLTDILGLRLRAAARRANIGTPRLRRVLSPALQQHNELQRELDELRAYLHEAIAVHQRIRKAQNQRRNGRGL